MRHMKEFVGSGCNLPTTTPRHCPVGAFYFLHLGALPQTPRSPRGRPGRCHGPAGLTPARRCRERTADLRASSGGPRPVLPPGRHRSRDTHPASRLRPPVRHLTRYGRRNGCRLLWAWVLPQLRGTVGRFAIEREVCLCKRLHCGRHSGLKRGHHGLLIWKA
jgi:hypothetical protein